mmetsp:Transcript_8910/g.22895  ORF Transcript_8910/g.22895 Transcript_8910/m.22895 type:complete len:246 (-) Transcript_8910:86-823(-)
MLRGLGGCQSQSIRLAWHYSPGECERQPRKLLQRKHKGEREREWRRPAPTVQDHRPRQRVLDPQTLHGRHSNPAVPLPGGDSRRRVLDVRGHLVTRVHPLRDGDGRLPLPAEGVQVARVFEGRGPPGADAGMPRHHAQAGGTPREVRQAVLQPARRAQAHQGLEHVGARTSAHREVRHARGGGAKLCRLPPTHAGVRPVHEGNCTGLPQASMAGANGRRNRTLMVSNWRWKTKQPIRDDDVFTAA